MLTIAVTGANSAVGRRLVRQLNASACVDDVVAVDARRLDELELTCDTLVHLAEEAAEERTVGRTVEVTKQLLEAADRGVCQHVVLLSSATVYGAHADNPVPITESHTPRPDDALSFVAAKWDAEQVLVDWVSATSGRSSAIVRPATTLSEHGAGWVARALRRAVVVRPDQIDPPTQFLHRDDLASALTLIARRQLEGIFNVAPDGWIGSDEFRELAEGIPVRLPKNIAARAGDLSRRYGVRPTPPGIEPYVEHPWVVANDRLRGLGWVPAFSNQEAFVLGTPAPPWSMSAQRRQEVALGVASAAVAGATAAALSFARRVTR